MAVYFLIMKDILTVGEAAKLLGVAPLTVRRWAKAKKLKSHRNPMNNYRLFRKVDILKIKDKLKGS